jgi:autotransporter-associated beta strand protein
MKPKYRSIALLYGVTITTAVADTYKISLDFSSGNATGGGTGIQTSGILGAMPGQTSGDVWNNVLVGNAWVGFGAAPNGLANGGASGGVATNTRVLNRTTGSSSPISLAVSTSSATGQRFQANVPDPSIAADAQNLMRDYLFRTSGSITLALSGFIPSETYTLYLYGAGDTSGQGGTWSVLPATGATFVGGDNITAAEDSNVNLTAGQDYIVVTFDGSSPTRSFTITNSICSINGFQLDAINAPTFANLAITGGASQVVGVPFNVTVTANDGAPVPTTVNDSTAPVTLSSSTPNSLLEFDWNMDNVYGDNSGTLVNGVKTVQVRTKKAQVGTTIIGSAGSATSLPLFTFDAAAGAYSQLQILAPGETAAPGTATGKTGSPTLQILNDGFSVTVNAVDLFWNPANPAVDPEVAITSTDGLATLPPPATIATNLSSYLVTFGSIGSYTVTATDTANALFTGTTGPLTVFGTPLTWVGDGTANLWNTVAPNWSGATTIYADPSQVTFEGSGSTTPAVSIVGTVSPSLVTVNSTTDYTFTGSGSIAGAFGGFNKAGSGSLTVSTANTYTGKTTVSGGVLILNNANALPNASPLALTGGILGLQSSDFTRAIGTGSNQVTLTSGSGFAALGANRVVNFGGALAPFSWDVDLIAGGTLVLNTASATHTLDFQNPITLSSGLNFFQVNDGTAAVDTILSGPITGGGIGFSKTGNGTLMLSNIGNAYRGFGTFIDSGKLILGASEVLPNSSGITIKRANGGGNIDAIFDINGFNETIGGIILGESGNNNTNVGQQPSLINSGAAGAVITLGGGNITYAAGNAGFPNGQATISANLATGTGIRTLVVGDGSATEDLVITGDLTGESIEKTGLGTLRIAKPLNTVNTTVTTGTLIVGAANPNNNASAVTIGAAGLINLSFAGTDFVTALTVNGVVQPDGVYGAAQHPGFISGAGTLTVGAAPADPYLAWAGVGVNFDADANNDGVDNGLAWFLGAGNPNVSANNLLPGTDENAGALVLTFVCLDGASRGAAVFEVQSSSDLGQLDSWVGTVVPGAIGTFTAGVVDFEVTAGPSAGKLTVVATIPVGEAVAGKVFGRIKGVN